MKQRLLTGWTFTRALYLVMGIFVIIQSVMDRQWFGIAFGGYFASMGLFAFGCAGGNCFNGNCAPTPGQKAPATGKDVDFEEIITK